ncbi:lysis system i-spanin subunit Rz [Atlantibacter hermannii]|uniref:lysis system i-spanin subunit Rz n=1 Tax=Atlantibacter hermannii TaxID=565 RepID=UPI00286E92E9|nr:lysis system i-spanin subunit Rz [Atlantibacter hermannii]
MQVRQRDVAALDAKYTKELADANAENDALRRRLDNGGRVRVKGRSHSGLHLHHRQHGRCRNRRTR